MKKLLLTAMMIVTTVAISLGQWRNDETLPHLEYWQSGETMWESSMQMAPNGNTWIAIHFPFGHVTEVEGVKDTTLCTGLGLQLIDTAGNYMFDEPVLVSLQPSASFTTIGSMLFVDRDGNAIVAKSDQRYDVDDAALESYAVYKVSQEGEMLWGKNGIMVHGENTYELATAIRMTQMSDGSYIFAWTHGGYKTPLAITMQRITDEGEMLWVDEPVTLSDGSSSYTALSLIDAGNNNVMLVYFKGSNNDLYVRKLDFEGVSAWEEDVRVYNGGWGSTPPYRNVTVKPSGDGGVILSWHDDRDAKNYETAYMCYVKGNGERAFYDNNGLPLTATEFRCLYVDCIYDPASDDFYATWLECDAGQSFYRIMAQRIDKESGELLWGDEGFELRPMDIDPVTGTATPTHYGYLTLQSGANNTIAFFFMQAFPVKDDASYISFGNVEGYVSTVDVSGDEAEPEIINLVDFTSQEGVKTEKSLLQSTTMYDNKFWVVKWTDSGAVGNNTNRVKHHYVQRINADLTLGNPAPSAVEALRIDDKAFSVASTIVDGVTYFGIDLSDEQQVTLAIYDVNGRVVAVPFEGVMQAGKRYVEWNANVPAGVYVATLTTAGNTETIKVLVK